MTFYNQHDYKHIPYNYKGGGGSTIKSSGCGVCCVCTVLSAFGIEKSVEEMAQYAMNIGARVSGGTVLSILGKAVAKQYNLEYSTSSDENAVANHLKNGGLAIANVGGDRGNYKGVFSNGGHYVVITGVKDDGRYIVYDVGEYSTKYSGSRAWRMENLEREGKCLICPKSIMNKETQNRSPNYYLFKKGELTKEQAKDVLRQKVGLSESTIQYIAEDYKWGEALVKKLADKIR